MHYNFGREKFRNYLASPERKKLHFIIGTLQDFPNGRRFVD